MEEKNEGQRMLYYSSYWNKNGLTKNQETHYSIYVHLHSVINKTSLCQVCGDSGQIETLVFLVTFRRSGTTMSLQPFIGLLDFCPEMSFSC